MSDVSSLVVITDDFLGAKNTLQNAAIYITSLKSLSSLSIEKANVGRLFGPIYKLISRKKECRLPQLAKIGVITVAMY